MVSEKSIHFDCYLNRFKAQNAKQFSTVIARQLASVCGSDSEVLSHLVLSKVESSEIQLIDGASIFDIQSPKIEEPAIMLATLASPIILGDDGQKPFDIVAGVVSDSQSGPAHLQKLSKISRLLRSQNFRDKVRSCDSVESMEVLFLPGQNSVKAA